jgi:NADH-quinone oxidoreductase subunit N
MPIAMPNLTPVMPEIVMTCVAIVMLLAELVINRKETLGFFSIISAGMVSYLLLGSAGTTFGGMFVSDGYSTFFKLIFMANLVLTILISPKYLQTMRINFGEYYALALFATLGMMLMASAADIIVLYLGLELMALSTYVLVGFIRYDMKSNEAAMKYLLLGAFASAILLYGTSMIYGLTGTTNL